MKKICILGSTGSIGVSSLDVVRLNKERYEIVALTANTNIDRLYQQCLEFQPKYAVLLNSNLVNKLQDKLRNTVAEGTQVLGSVSALEYVAESEEVDYVIAAIVGAAGLLPTLAAAKAGKRILLANKEALVMSGDIFMDAVAKNGAELLPLDSEHNALFQCMPADYRIGDQPKGIRKLLLTASGGPFRLKTNNELKSVTPEQACAHPNWSMGKKISVDSATLMNKGLEVIEASYLFNLSAELIEVLVHPQSVIHSMVDYVDGSVLAQMGNPDMRTPIAHALAWPVRHQSGVSALDFVVNNSLSFEEPDYQRFPCLKLAFDALEAKGTAPTILNAANEIAVDAFLNNQLGFMQIPELIDSVLNELPVDKVDSLGTVLEVDQRAREKAVLMMKGLN